MQTINRENVRDIFHLMVLKALDEAANETFKPNRNDSGAIDVDLPRLFKAIDDQIEVLAIRHGFILED